MYTLLILFSQLFGKNVHITNVCPGFVSTDVAKNALTKDGSQFGRNNQFVAQGMTAERWGCQKDGWDRGAVTNEWVVPT